MSHFQESVSLGPIFSNDSKLLDQVREIVALGKYEGSNRLPSLKADIERFLDPKPNAKTKGVSKELAVGELIGPRARMAEAIVLMIARPSLLVRDGSFILPTGPSKTVPQQTLDEIAKIDRAKAAKVIAATARIEIEDNRMPFVGTGWIVRKPKKSLAIIATNRHVAQEFARANERGGYVFLRDPAFRDYVVKADFNEEYGAKVPREAVSTRVLFIAGANDPDIALLEIGGDAVSKLDAISLASGPPKKGDQIGVVGYPAYDSRNDPEAIASYFGEIFNVKRFAFGDVTGLSSRFPEMMHDATTLGGNSGSCVYDRATGEAVGLHFSGEFLKGNYAVHASEVDKAVSGLTTKVFMPRREGTEAPGDGRSPVASFKGRDGFDREFLGRGQKRIEMPKPGSWDKDLAKVKDADTGRTSTELKYRHFSVIMSASRKLPLISAVNINGAKSKRLGRVDQWKIDGRLGDEFQVDNAAYASNPLDRGHMVRREDPVWGSMEEASEANIDTFHYTNAAPQHEALNQRTWVSLEDYVLGSARTHKLLVSVFTGPIMKADDALYRELVRLPRAFWKVAAIVNSDTGKLSVTGYILAQGNLIRKLTEAFVYGEFQTYQVPLSLIQSEAGIDLSDLLEHDPLAAKRRDEGLEGTNTRLFVPIASGADLIL